MPAAAILVVEDDPDVADVVATALTMSGHVVEAVADGHAALEELSRRPYDLVISDLRMPNLDGPALYDRVAWEYPALSRRFVFVSADISRPPMRAFLDATGAPALPKPFDVLVLQRTVDAVLERTPQSVAASDTERAN